ncbi:MAG: thiamine pyrophosphate-binding protein [Desulfobacterales bacterium]|nr:thiamine pyrophosphate-binding protein [Desulfobacteraceae bacterium]MBT4365212.1 thiamine pyrophosphate-binding protein [Desulfobacteraceae bacterium]MBT7085337.1 thiamine pyrophosphate-binding protein [Desulfobacterales bacterium]MBT7698133.1 thiamine pyrophosphate-binding protein [Desulfobacterales bacterium]
MAKLDGGALIGRILKEQNVKYMFAINGAHIFPILGNLMNNDIKLIHMRHEQATAYAADGYARSTGTPGVCCVTAGCGLTNALTGLCTADQTNSSVICLSGQHPLTEDNIGSFQEAYGSEIMRTFSKFSKRVLDWSTIEIDMRQAFREAMSPPQGVSLLEIPINVLYHEDDETKQRRGAKIYDQGALSSQGDPLQIERAVELIYNAKKPLIAGGDGIFWSKAGPELKEFAELTNTPVYCRRAGQGAVDEASPLAIRGAWKKPFTGEADVVLAIGFKFWSGEKFGDMPTWNDKANYIQVDSSAQRVGWHVPATVGIVGDPKLVLRQMIDKIKEMKLDFSAKRESPWFKMLAEVRGNYEKLISDREKENHNTMPIHPDRLVKDLVSVIDKDATLVIDSFTLSGYTSQWFNTHFPGQVVDAGPLAPVGHGVGMGIGVQLARPGKQVIVVSGDGGLGIGGMDMETAAKYKLPITTLLWNNSSWGPSFESTPYLKGRTEPFDMIPGIRYDKVFEPMGVHGEHVEKPDEIIPALERALKSGKASLVNVVGDKTIGHPTLGGNLLGPTQI